MPSPSTPTVTGDVWSPSPDRRVTSTAQWLRATNARASSGLTRPPWWSARLARLNPRSRLFGGHLNPQQPEGHLDGRTDPEGEQDGTDAGRATEQHADDQHAGLDDRPDDADPQPGARRDRQHQGVPGARPEPGADVQRGAERHQEDTDDHGGQAHRQPARAQVGADAGGEHRVREDPDEHHVDQRARPGPDAGQGPGDQQDHADEDGRDPEGQGRHVADAVMEHIPGPGAEPVVVGGGADRPVVGPWNPEPHRRVWHQLGPGQPAWDVGAVELGPDRRAPGGQVQTAPAARHPDAADERLGAAGLVGHRRAPPAPIGSGDAQAVGAAGLPVVGQAAGPEPLALDAGVAAGVVRAADRRPDGEHRQPAGAAVVPEVVGLEPEVAHVPALEAPLVRPEVGRRAGIAQHGQVPGEAARAVGVRRPAPERVRPSRCGHAIRIADTPQVRKPPSRRECPERLGVADYALIRTGLGAQDVTEAQQAGGPTVRRMLVGSQLRRLRVQSGISREEAGARIRASEWKIHRLENGQVGFKERDVVDLLALYGVTDPAEVEAVLDLARETKDTGWWHHYGDLLPPWFRAYVDLEQAATLIRAYEGQFVPGLLQTDDYMRAVMGGALDETPDETDRRVELRLARQALLTRPGPPRLWAVVDEGALRRPVGGPRVMRAQLDRLIEYSRLPSVVLQILPFGAGAHPAMVGAFSILRFADDDLPDVVYLEHLTGAMYLDKRDDVLRYLHVMESISVRAGRPADSEDILAAIAKEI